jgi:hypothetical protein
MILFRPGDESFLGNLPEPLKVTRGSKFHQWTFPYLKEPR